MSALPSNKEEYRKLCETEGENIPLFLQYWWWETVCYGKEWDVLMVCDGDSVLGALPYVIDRKMGFRFVLQPQLTQYCGPWLRRQDDQATFDSLVAQLRGLRYHFLQFNLSPAVSRLVLSPDFEVTPRRTLRIDDISDPDKVFKGFDRRKRQKPIVKAEQELEWVHHVTPRQFAEFHHDYWSRRGQTDMLSVSFIEHVVSCAMERGHGFLSGLCDSQGRLHGASFDVYDSHEAHALMSALGKDHHPGTRPLLFWKSISRYSTLTQMFDFEGSMDPGIAYSYELYGAKPVDFFQITHCRAPLFRMLMKFKRR